MQALAPAVFCSACRQEARRRIARGGRVLQDRAGSDEDEEQAAEQQQPSSTLNGPAGTEEQRGLEQLSPSAR